MTLQNDLPSGWTAVKIGSLAAPKRNALVGGPFGSNLVSRDYVESGTPVIRGQNLGLGRWATGEFVYVSSEKAASLSANIARPGDIVFTQRGTLGQVALVPDEPNQEYIVSQSQMKLTVDPMKSDPQYLYYLFSDPTMVDYIRSNAIQTGVPHINLGILRELLVTVPPLEEQRAIAHILGTLDDRIELNRQMNQTLDELARTIFRSWFVDFDPVRAKAEGREPEGMDAETAALFPDRFVDSALGQIPEGWEWGLLNQVANNVRVNVPAEELSANDHYVGLEHFGKRQTVLYEWGTATEVTSNKSRFRENDILFGKLRPYFHKVSLAPVNGVCSTDVLVIRPERADDLSWILSIASSDNMIEHATLRSSGTRMPRSNWADVGGFQIAMPPVEVRDAFDHVVMPMLSLMKAKIFEVQTLAELRDTLLPELLSGRIEGSITGGR